MHELSIGNRIVELASDCVREAGGARATAVTVRIGALTCVHEDALRFCYELVRESTPLAAAELRIIRVPVTIWCGACGRAVELPGIQKLACPTCGTPSGDIRAGCELDLESIELEPIELDEPDDLVKPASQAASGEATA
ncbi:MAG: hydrogenase maturation nickel metallochaperone HypA [Pirellulales bacterium]